MCTLCAVVPSRPDLGPEGSKKGEPVRVEELNEVDYLLSKENFTVDESRFD